MLPFDLYPAGGRQLLGMSKGANARHEYGLKFMQLTRQTHCAYCDTGLTASYEMWLRLVLDHVIPASLCKSTHIPDE